MMARIACLVVLLCSTGCATVTSWQRCFYDHCRAKSALHQLQSSAAVPEFGPYARHFHQGFKAGYTSVARGGDGTEPLLPPSVYASFKYRDAAGNEAVNAWYQGFRAGAEAALNDGVRELNYLPLSPRYQEFLIAQQHDSRTAVEPMSILPAPAPAVEPESPRALPPVESFELPPPDRIPDASSNSSTDEMRRLPSVEPLNSPQG